jgi:hypothetical protein
MNKFPIMQMRAGDNVTITGYYGQLTGTVRWFDRHEGWRVNVDLPDGTNQTFEAQGPRRCWFWH